MDVQNGQTRSWEVVFAVNHVYFTLNLDRLIIFRLPKLIPCLAINDPQFDGVVVVTDTVQKLVDNKLDKVAAAVQEYAKVSSSTVLTSNLDTP